MPVYLRMLGRIHAKDRRAIGNASTGINSGHLQRLQQPPQLQHKGPVQHQLPQIWHSCEKDPRRVAIHRALPLRLQMPRPLLLKASRRRNGTRTEQVAKQAPNKADKAICRVRRHRKQACPQVVRLVLRDKATATLRSKAKRRAASPYSDY